MDMMCEKNDISRLIFETDGTKTDQESTADENYDATAKDLPKSWPALLMPRTCLPARPICEPWHQDLHQICKNVEVTFPHSRLPCDFFEDQSHGTGT
jgi:hypothetical protein